MKRRFAIVSIFVTAILSTYSVKAQSTSFSYQGTLNQGVLVANGLYDFEFRLYDAVSGGAQVGVTNTFNAVSVRNGQFTVNLSFGLNAFPGGDRWIQISVRHGGGGAFSTLLPRQAVTTTPYAMTSLRAGSLAGTLAVTNGGTGATDGGTARSNLGAAASGSNGDITALSGLTTPLSVTQGGTGATSASAARASIGAAGSGANSDITALTGLTTPLGIGLGGTGAATATSARVSIGAAGSGANADITSIGGLTTPLSLAQGGTGASSANGARGSIGAAGSGANSDITALMGLTTPISVAQGGTGMNIGPSTAGQYLRSSAAGVWSISNITIDDIPNLSAGYVDLNNNQTIGGNKNFSGIISGNGAGITGIKGTISWEVMNTDFQSVGNRAYIIDSSSQTTITLPLNPITGDVIRIVGYGSGSWRIVPNSGQAVMTMLDGLSHIISPEWVARESNRNWEDITSSDDGTKLAAVENGGYIYVSSDSGVSWTPRDQIRAWSSIASSSDGTILAATVSNGQIYVSTDSGLTWNARATARQWSKIAISSDGSNQIAVGDLTHTSDDGGVTWTARASVNNLQYVASSSSGKKIIAALGSFSTLYISNDFGVHWNTTATGGQWRALTISGENIASYAAINSGQIYSQTNSDPNESWTSIGANRQWIALASSDDGARIIAADEQGKLYTSSDFGQSWVARDSNRNWRGVTSSADGKKLAAIVRDGKIYTYSEVNGYLVPPGKYLTGAIGGNIEIVYMGNGRYFIVSATGKFMLT